MKVLIVEDDGAVADGIADGLGSAAVGAIRAVDGRSALDLAELHVPDAVVLDLGLPDMDGTDVCRALRSRSGVPIIVVSARGEEMDRVLALELGADDYLVKPFGMRELLARLRAVARRASGAGNAAEQPPTRRFGALAIDLRARRVNLDGLALHLTPTEFELLAHLSSDPGAVQRRSDILRDVWHTEWYGATKTLDAHIAALRRKLGDPGWIESVRGVGFRFEPQR
ncbi:response regulator transcription factor [Herbiconiux sp. SYSU D00978]|uniref:response regulator transcription factor n=1 Tax=Herbiconiux sp. SYSU D00978 TaxID=2812562 RepID=UPI001A966183|nr:response regulator transcription factor [Herbiconiux sp. SYSU D00978]